ncbi:MAG TPA: hypothetical protein VGZ50_07160, partial [Actinomycetota bacterium]|nr:hypothetical protein [Actinomycetota bacterium]
EVTDSVEAVEDGAGQHSSAVEIVRDSFGHPSDSAKTVQDAAGQVPTSIDSVVEEGAAETSGSIATVDGTAGQSAGTFNPVESGVARESPERVGAIEKTLTQTSKTVSGTKGAAVGAAEFSASGGAATDREGRTTFTRKWMTGELDGWTRGRGVLRFALALGASQPSLALLVDAVNDADGDGIFSDPETAPEPGADVSFKALITNIGTTQFVVAAVTHTYTGTTGPVQVRECGELAGIMVAPGETMACTFLVPDYSPVRGETAVSTVTAAAFETGKGARRGASDSDSSTVDTLLASDKVLAVAIKQNLAFTGTDAARLVALGLVLLAAGGGLVYLARVRSGRPIRPPVRSQSSLEMLGWLAAPSGARSRSKEKAWRR